MPAKFTLVFDGGSRGNPGPAFGSFRLQRKGQRPLAPERLTFPRGTNNEAEYWSLLAGLDRLLEIAGAAELMPGDIHLEIRGDSQLVLNQIQGTWKAKDARMKRYRDQARAILESFGAVRFAHQDRWRTVEILDH